jgi:endonuclease/exonuclease/phosphatase family metal-dependent hydrolase
VREAVRVHVLTLNLFGRDGGWSERREVVRAGLRRMSPDLVALQDVARTPEYDQVADVVDAGYAIVHQERRAPDGSGISTATRWPVLRVHQLDLEVTDRAHGFPCTALAVEVAGPQPIGPVLLVNRRTSWQLTAEHERELEAVAVARWIERLVAGRRLHVVIAGDLNAAPDAASVRFLLGLQSLEGTSVCYRDAWSAVRTDLGATFTPANALVRDGEMPLEPGRRIDYVLVRCTDSGPTLAVAGCDHAFDAPVDGVWASDHFGVMAELTPPRR